MSEEVKTDDYIQELPPVAKSLYLLCKKCESNRYFTVLAHKTEKSARLECEVCKAKKAFTIKKPKVKKKTTGTRRRSSKNIYQDLLVEVGATKAVPYNMRSKFSVHSAINHNKFGLGFVKEATALKIEVVFEDQTRELVHNRVSSPPN